MWVAEIRRLLQAQFSLMKGTVASIHLSIYYLSLPLSLPLSLSLSLSPSPSPSLPLPLYLSIYLSHTDMVLQSGTLDRSNYKGKARSGSLPQTQLHNIRNISDFRSFKKQSVIWGFFQGTAKKCTEEISSVRPPPPHTHTLTLSLPSLSLPLSATARSRLFIRNKKMGKRPETQRSGRRLAALEPSASLPAGLAHSARPTHSLTPYTAESEGEGGAHTHTIDNRAIIYAHTHTHHRSMHTYTHSLTHAHSHTCSQLVKTSQTPFRARMK